MKHSNGFSYLDAIVAIVITSFMLAGLIPFLSLATRKLPEEWAKTEHRRETLNIYRDLKQVAEKLRAPYWSDGPTITINDNTISLSEKNYHVIITHTPGSITIESDSIKRRYKHSQNLKVKPHYSSRNFPLGFNLSYGTQQYFIPFPHRPLESPAEESNAS